MESLIFSGMRKRRCFIKGFELVRGGFFVVFRAQDCGKRILGTDFLVCGENPGFGDGFSRSGDGFSWFGSVFPWFVVDFSSNPLILLHFPCVL